MLEYVTSYHLILTAEKQFLKPNARQSRLKSCKQWPECCAYYVVGAAVLAGARCVKVGSSCILPLSGRGVRPIVTPVLHEGVPGW